MNPIVSLSDLSHTYPAKGKNPPREALRGVSFGVRPGETFGLLGPNGGGKSTLFRILSTYFPATSGKALIFGQDAASSPKEIRPRLGVVFQNPSLDSKLTVHENMIHQGHLYGLSGTELERRTGELLERYRLSDRAGELAGSLSGGLRRRVELAKGLLHKPELILMDEPSTGLDPGARKDLWGHLNELKTSRKITLMVTTHLMDEAENCDRLALLDRGAVAALGTPEALKAEIRGDVITIESQDPNGLKAKVKERFGLEASLDEDRLHIEREKGHSFIPQLVEAFPGLIRSVSLSKPSLEDVFLHHTGHRFWTAKEEAS